MKKTILTILLCGVMIFVITGCTEQNSNPNNDPQDTHSFEGTVVTSERKNIIVEPNENEDERKIADKFLIELKDEVRTYSIGTKVKITYVGGINESYPAQIGTTKIEVIENEYAEDNIVNKFIVEYNSLSTNDINNIEKGNIRTKYFGYSNECYLELLNANNSNSKSFNITINGTNEEPSIDKIFVVYKEAIKVLEPTLNVQQINESISTLKSSQYLKEIKLGDNIKIAYYPITELSWGKTKCRIEISSSNYKF